MGQSRILATQLQVQTIRLVMAPYDRLAGMRQQTNVQHCPWQDQSAHNRILVSGFA
jgi:hypothetical protein